VKLIRHDTLMKPQQLTLEAVPLTIWLDRKTELQIEYGDRCGDVAKIVAKEWDLTRMDSVQLVALWFAIGVRVKHSLGGSWKRLELKPAPDRRYLRHV
jgi:hypothetical protein